MPDEEPLVDDLEREIRDYLRAHPHAADTLEGIVQWWIVQERFLRGIQAANRALERLVAKGEVERILAADGRTIFRAVRKRRRRGVVRRGNEDR